MERIVFLDRKTCRTALRPPRFPHQWQDHDTTAPEELADRLRDATIVITNKVPLRAPQINDLRGLRLIAVAATGVDVVDLDASRRLGIAVCNLPRYTLNSVPEHVFMLMLALQRNLFNYRKAVTSGLWAKSPIFSLLDYPIHDLAGSTLGIIGYGALGQEVEKRGRAFGMDILIAERKGASPVRSGRVPFEEVLRRSDIVTLHCPLTPDTRHLIGSHELTLMKPRALLINAARGGLIDESALANALQFGLLGGAAVDVLSQEPPAADHPLPALDLPRLIITPHIGWASEEAVRTLAEELISNLEAFVAGSPKNVVM
ncbi:MAG: glycerate dehydrogenase [Elusimicrobia bacterium RIFCSPLOWO2_01_FULL_59_12]|nr:MAG: glycerate dehydrogenase [Elusimicrobia bacterium RIFCSPLOWO2_01_FULL_59_12]